MGRPVCGGDAGAPLLVLLLLVVVLVLVLLLLLLLLLLTLHQVMSKLLRRMRMSSVSASDQIASLGALLLRPSPLAHAHHPQTMKVSRDCMCRQQHPRGTGAVLGRSC